MHPPSAAVCADQSVLTLDQIDAQPLRALLAAHGLVLQRVADGAAIPGSYWGEPEAGLIGCTVFVRGDTPVHSVLHEACHLIVQPPERRALVLIDPPFEAQDEFARILGALDTALKRLPSGVFAVWHPLTRRARTAEFLAGVAALRPPPALRIELTVAGEESELKMRGCGIVVINPPWQFDQAANTLVSFLASVLAQEPGGAGRVEWLVRER